MGRNWLLRVIYSFLNTLNVIHDIVWNNRKCTSGIYSLCLIFLFDKLAIIHFFKNHYIKMKVILWMQFQNYMPICRLNKNIFGSDNNKSFFKVSELNSREIESWKWYNYIFFVSNSKMLNIIPTAVLPSTQIK